MICCILGVSGSGWVGSGTVYNDRGLIEEICERCDDIIVMTLRIHTDISDFLEMEGSE